MDEPTADPPEPRCGFCGRTQREAASLKESVTFFAGPGVYLCAACVRELAGILDEDAGSSG
jgi:hypothetical protein